MPKVEVSLDDADLRALRSALNGKAARAALRKAGTKALRDMRAEASKRIRQRKRIKIQIVHRALSMVRPRGANLDDLSWTLAVSGKAVPLSAYPHRQTRKGVSVEVNRGKRTLVRSAFLAKMRSGHQGIYQREGMARLPINERFGSRPTDALLHAGEKEAVAERGMTTLVRTFRAMLPVEIEKAKR